MLIIHPHDLELDAATGATLAPSTNQRRITYVLDHKLGAGGMSVIFKARRCSPQGESIRFLRRPSWCASTILASSRSSSAPGP